MKVYIAEICEDDEYGFMSVFSVFASEEAAHAAAKKAGFQNTDPGEDYAFRTDYYKVSEWKAE